jgi:TP901 family phage tail tape measure protein
MADQSYGGTDITLTAMMDTASLRRIEGQIATIAGKPINLKFNAQPLGRITSDIREFDKSLEAANARVLAFGASAGVIFQTQRAFAFLLKSMVDVEKQMADMNAIFGLSNRKLAEFGKEIFNIAQDTAQSFDTVTKAATEFARQGLSFEETGRRTRDAMILMRTGSMEAEKAVKTLTAIVNGFGDAALSTNQILNKMVAVDQKFAVSTEDLAEALARSGATAHNAKVNLDQLFAIITALQQTTARGGPIIGNALKSIFTRMQRPAVLDYLERVGFKVRDAQKAMLPAMDVLNNLASGYDDLSESIRSNVNEQVAGVYQVNQFQAAMRVLSDEFGTYTMALYASSQATAEAIQRNIDLNRTLSAKMSRTVEAARENLSQIGSDVVGPAVDNLLNSINNAFDMIEQHLSDDGIGSKISRGIMKGVGTFMAGPALLGGIALGGKLFINLARDAREAVRTIAELNRGTSQYADAQRNVMAYLQKHPEAYQRVKSGLMSVVGLEKEYLNYVRLATRELEGQALLAATIGPNLLRSGDVRLRPNRQAYTPKTKASGYIPSDAARAEIDGAASMGYRAGQIKTMDIKGVGPVVYNGAETVIDVPNFAQPIIAPPPRSKGYEAFRQKAKQRTMVDIKDFQSDGFIPSMAAPRFLSAREVLINKLSSSGFRSRQALASMSEAELKRLNTVFTTSQESGSLGANAYIKHSGANDSIDEFVKNLYRAKSDGFVPNMVLNPASLLSRYPATYRPLSPGASIPEAFLKTMQNVVDQLKRTGGVAKAAIGRTSPSSNIGVSWREGDVTLDEIVKMAVGQPLITTPALPSEVAGENRAQLLRNQIDFIKMLGRRGGAISPEGGGLLITEYNLRNLAKQGNMPEEIAKLLRLTTGRRAKSYWPAGHPLAGRPASNVALRAIDLGFPDALQYMTAKQAKSIRLMLALSPQFNRDFGGGMAELSGSLPILRTAKGSPLSTDKTFGPFDNISGGEIETAIGLTHRNLPIKGSATGMDVLASELIRTNPEELRAMTELARLHAGVFGAEASRGQLRGFSIKSAASNTGLSGDSERVALQVAVRAMTSFAQKDPALTRLLLMSQLGTPDISALRGRGVKFTGIDVDTPLSVVERKLANDLYGKRFQSKITGEPLKLFENLSHGFIPNAADSLEDAKSREVNRLTERGMSEYKASRAIRVGLLPQVQSPINPKGEMVYNTIDETGPRDAARLHAGKDLRMVGFEGAFGGAIPNFAAPRKPMTQALSSLHTKQANAMFSDILVKKRSEGGGLATMTDDQAMVLFDLARLATRKASGPQAQLMRDFLVGKSAGGYSLELKKLFSEAQQLSIKAAWAKDPIKKAKYAADAQEIQKFLKAVGDLMVKRGIKIFKSSFPTEDSAFLTDMSNLPMTTPGISLMPMSVPTISPTLSSAAYASSVSNISELTSGIATEDTLSAEDRMREIMNLSGGFIPNMAGGMQLKAFEKSLLGHKVMTMMGGSSLPIEKRNKLQRQFFTDVLSGANKSLPLEKQFPPSVSALHEKYPQLFDRLRGAFADKISSKSVGFIPNFAAPFRSIDEARKRGYLPNIKHSPYIEGGSLITEVIDKKTGEMRLARIGTGNPAQLEKIAQKWSSVRLPELIASERATIPFGKSLPPQPDVYAGGPLQKPKSWQVVVPRLMPIAEGSDLPSYSGVRAPTYKPEALVPDIPPVPQPLPPLPPPPTPMAVRAYGKGQTVEQREVLAAEARAKRSAQIASRDARNLQLARQRISIPPGQIPSAQGPIASQIPPTPQMPPPSRLPPLIQQAAANLQSPITNRSGLDPENLGSGIQQILSGQIIGSDAERLAQEKFTQQQKKAEENLARKARRENELFKMAGLAETEIEKATQSQGWWQRRFGNVGDLIGKPISRVQRAAGEITKMKAGLGAAPIGSEENALFQELGGKKGESDLMRTLIDKTVNKRVSDRIALNDKVRSGGFMASMIVQPALGIASEFAGENRKAQGAIGGLSTFANMAAMGSLFGAPGAIAGGAIGAGMGIKQYFDAVNDGGAKFQKTLEGLTEKTQAVNASMTELIQAEEELFAARKSGNIELMDLVGTRIAKSIAALSSQGIDRGTLKAFTSGNKDEIKSAVEKIGTRQREELNINKFGLEVASLRKKAEGVLGFWKPSSILDNKTMFESRQLKDALTASFMGGQKTIDKGLPTQRLETTQEFLNRPELQYVVKDLKRVNNDIYNELVNTLDSLQSDNIYGAEISKHKQSQASLLADISGELEAAFKNLQYEISAQAIVKQGRIEAGLARIGGGIDRGGLSEKALINLDDILARAKADADFSAKFDDLRADSLNFVGNMQAALEDISGEKRAKALSFLTETVSSGNIDPLQVSRIIKDIVGSGQDSAPVIESIDKLLTEYIGKTQLLNAEQKRTNLILSAQKAIQEKQLQIQQDRATLGGVEAIKDFSRFSASLDKIGMLPKYLESLRGERFLGTARPMSQNAAFSNLSGAFSAVENIRALLPGAEIPQDLRDELKKANLASLAARSINLQQKGVENLPGVPRSFRPSVDIEKTRQRLIDIGISSKEGVFSSPYSILTAKNLQRMNEVQTAGQTPEEKISSTIETSIKTLFNEEGFKGVKSSVEDVTKQIKDVHSFLEKQANEQKTVREEEYRKILAREQPQLKRHEEELKLAQSKRDEIVNRAKQANVTIGELGNLDVVNFQRNMDRGLGTAIDLAKRSNSLQNFDINKYASFAFGEKEAATLNKMIRSGTSGTEISKMLMKDVENYATLTDNIGTLNDSMGYLRTSTSIAENGLDKLSKKIIDTFAPFTNNVLGSGRLIDEKMAVDGQNIGPVRTNKVRVGGGFIRQRVLQTESEKEYAKFVADAERFGRDAPIGAVEISAAVAQAGAPKKRRKNKKTSSVDSEEFGSQTGSSTITPGYLAPFEGFKTISKFENIMSRISAIKQTPEYASGTLSKDLAIELQGLSDELIKYKEEIIVLKENSGAYKEELRQITELNMLLEYKNLVGAIRATSQEFTRANVELRQRKRAEARLGAFEDVNAITGDPFSSTSEFRGGYSNLAGNLRVGEFSPELGRVVSMGDYMGARAAAIGGMNAQTPMEQTADLVESSLQEIKGSFSDAFKTIANGSEDMGTALLQNFANMLTRIRDKMMDQAIDNIFNRIYTKAFPAPQTTGQIGAFARGGVVKGGSGVRDDVPARLMDGEFVIKKAMAKKYGYDILNALNDGKAKKFGKGGVNIKETPSTYFASLDIDPGDPRKYAKSGFGGNLSSMFKETPLGSVLTGYADEYNSEMLRIAQEKKSAELEIKRQRNAVYGQLVSSGLSLAGGVAGGQFGGAIGGAMGKDVGVLAGTTAGGYLGSYASRRFYANGGLVIPMAKGGEFFGKGFKDYNKKYSKAIYKEIADKRNALYAWKFEQSKKNEMLGAIAETVGVIAGAAAMGYSAMPTSKKGIPVNAQNIPVGVPVNGNVTNTMAYRPAIAEQELMAELAIGRSGIPENSFQAGAFQFADTLPTLGSPSYRGPSAPSFGGYTDPRNYSLARSMPSMPIYNQTSIGDNLKYIHGRSSPVYPPFYNPALQSNKIRYASGGATMDNIPALLTAGEFVFNKDAVNRIGKPLLDQMNNGALPTNGIRRYEFGGYVSGKNLDQPVNNDVSKVVADTGRGGGNMNNSVSISVNVHEGGRTTTEVKSDTEDRQNRKDKAEEFKKLGQVIDQRVAEFMTNMYRPGGKLYGGGRR